jgi:2,4-dienoyl-CoA reductase-like NADH-dependent reductase (Old Yellow Enzyme family)
VGSVGLDGEFLQLMVSTDKVAQPASLENLLQRLAADEFDLVAVGRALLVDPDWAVKVREGREQDILPFSRDALTTLV